MGDEIKKTIRAIKIKNLKKILDPFDKKFDDFLIGIPQRTTLLIFDKNRKHFGSIYLKEEVELQKEAQ